MRLLLDTHVFVWLLQNSARISGPVYQQIEAAADSDELFVSAITPWEIAMLVSKGRLGLNRDVGEWLRAALGLPGIHLDAAFAGDRGGKHAAAVDVHPDPADRILLATARHLDATLLSADRQMLAYGEQGHVKCIGPA